MNQPRYPYYGPSRAFHGVRMQTRSPLEPRVRSRYGPDNGLPRPRLPQSATRANMRPKGGRRRFKKAQKKQVIVQTVDNQNTTMVPYGDEIIGVRDMSISPQDNSRWDEADNVLTKENLSPHPVIPLDVDVSKALLDVDERMLEDATYEELEQLYRSVHSELTVITEAEKEFDTSFHEPYSPHSSDDDLLLSLRLKALKSKNVKAPTDSAFSPSPQSPETNSNSNDKKEHGPLLIPLDEKATDASPEMSLSGDVERLRVKPENEKEADELREQLLKSMLFKKKDDKQAAASVKAKANSNLSPASAMAPPSLVDSALTRTVSEHMLSDRSQSPNLIVQLQQNLSDKRPANSLVPLKPHVKPSALPHKVKPLVIHFGDDSSDDEFGFAKKPSARSGAREVMPPVLAALDAMLREARLQSEQTSQLKVTVSKTRHSKVYARQPQKAQSLPLNNIVHLSVDQQLVYVQLKRRLDKQEKQKQLSAAEANVHTLKNALPAKNSKATILKCKQNRKQIQFTEAQKKCQEAYEAYLAADRILAKTTVELNTVKTEVKSALNDIAVTRVALITSEHECMKLGTELQGASYEIPSKLPSPTKATVPESMKVSESSNGASRDSTVVKRKHTSSESEGPRRKSSRVESTAVSVNEQLLQQEKSRLEEMESILKSRMEVLEGISHPKTKPAEKKRKIDDFKAAEAKKENAIDEKIMKELDHKVRSYIKLLPGVEPELACSVASTWNLMNCPAKAKPLRQSFSVSSPSQRASNNDDSISAIHCDSGKSTLTTVRVKNRPPTHAESPYTSVLSHLHSSRLRTTEVSTSGHLSNVLTSSVYANNLNPNEVICSFDLSGKCTDKKCKMQHRSSYSLSEVEKIVDLLLYSPTVALKDSMNNLGSNDSVAANDGGVSRDKLLSFVKRYIAKEPETSPAQLMKLVQNSVNIKGNSLADIKRSWNRFSNAIYTFHDFSYNFKLKARPLVLTHGMMLNLKQSQDIEPDNAHISSTTSRFFLTGKSSSFAAELESSLENNPKDIQLWLKLAYLKLSESEKETGTKITLSKNARLVEALKVLAKALQQNKHHSELWQHYIYIYANSQIVHRDDRGSRRRGSNVSSQKQPTLLDICKMAVEMCSTIQVWKCYVSHCYTIDEKIASSHDLIQALVKRKLKSDSPHNWSHHLVEAVTYRVRLHLQTGRRDKAEILLKNGLVNPDLRVPTTFKSALDVVRWVENIEDASHVNSLKTPTIAKMLTVRDRVFLWSCYISLAYNQRLPSACFEPFGQGFSGLVHKKPLVFSWDNITSNSLYTKLLEMFAAALWHCFSVVKKEFAIESKLDAVAPLLANLWQLETNWCARTKPQENATVPLFIEMLDNCNLLRLDMSKFFWLLMAEAQMNGNQLQTALDTIKRTKFYKACDQTFLYFAAFIAYEFRDLEQLRRVLTKMAKPYVDDNLPQEKLEDLHRVFRAILCEESLLDVRVTEIRLKYYSKYPLKCAKLWLGYIFLNILDGTTSDIVEALFETALSMCEPEVKEYDMHLLWFTYLKYLSQRISSQRDFDRFFSRLKHCCLITKDNLFHSKLVVYFSNLVRDDASDRVKFLIELAKSISHNPDLVAYTVRTGLKAKENQLVFGFLEHLVNENKYSNFDDYIWKTTIALAINNRDHYQVHRLFQLALSTHPYSAGLWDLSFKYEKSFGHANHLKEGRSLYEKLKMPTSSSSR